MRMWGVNPGYLCNQHLLGEHVEMHMFAGTIARGRSIAGYLAKGLVNPCRIKTRHDLLAAELKKRGMNHHSPLEMECRSLSEVTLNLDLNTRELRRRCPVCRTRLATVIR